MSRKNSKKKVARKSSGGVGRLVGWLIVMGLAVSAVSVAALAGAFWYYSNDPYMPRVETLRTYVPEQCETIRDSSGRVLDKLGRYKRTAVPFGRYPKVLIHAVLAAEDAHFFRHQGIDLLGMLRAFIINLRAGHMRQGGSTITQQVVKNLLLTPKKTLRRKIQEVILARRLENELSKERILELYLNQVYLGHGRYGMEEAAQYYFGRHVWELTLPQAALLAGLVQGPELLSPFKHPDRAKKRREYVLRRMHEHGFITGDELMAALKAPLPSVPHGTEGRRIAPEVVQYVEKLYPLDRFAGKDIITTIDLDLQKTVRRALQKGLRRVDRRLRVTVLSRIPKPRKLSGGIMLGRVCCRRSGQVVVDLPGGERGVVLEGWDRYYPKGYDWVDKVPKSWRRWRRMRRKHKLPVIAPTLALRVREIPGKTGNPDAPHALALELGPQGAVVLLGLPDASVLALAGGYEPQPGMFDRATRSLRQPGSTFKPFVYALALESKKFTPATIINDAPTVHGKWVPKSYSRYLGPVRLRVGLMKSLNSIAVQLASAVGPKRIVQLAHAAGISTPLAEDLSIALGSSGVKPFELAGAYTIFPLLGVARKPYMVKSVGGRTVVPKEGRRVISQQAAWLMISLMRSVVENGTARRARKLPFKVAGKTGTTNHSRDAWFAGYNRHFICVVWVGFDDGKPMGRRITGGSGALPIFMDVMKTAMAGKKDDWFPMVPGIVTQLIDPTTGQAVRPGTPGAITEYFMEGTAPQPPPLEEMTSDGTAHENAGDLLMEDE